MKLPTGRIVAGLLAATAVAGCGSTTAPQGSAREAADSVQAAASPGIDTVALMTGSDQERITHTIRAFYKATWQDDTTGACSLFSPAGRSGFLESAKVAFPASVNATTTCADAMRFFNADLADAVQNLQQAGINVSGNVLDVVEVKDIRVHGDSATAEAPVGVQEFIQPKTFMLVRRQGRWLIDGSRKIGQTLPQLLAEAKRKHELVPGVTTPPSGTRRH